MALDLMYDPFHATFLGIRMYQVWPDIMLWEKFFQEHHIATLLEIGTAKGGLSMFFLLQAKQRRFIFWTYDIKVPDDTLGMPLGEDLRRAFVKEDAFAPGLKSLITVAQRPLMIFCDGGDKRREAREFTPLLRSGDFIAVHDWHNEIDEKDIDKILTPLYKEECEKHESWTRWFELK